MRRVEHVMGTAIGVEVRDRSVSEGVLDSVYGWLRYVDARFSTCRSDSDISRLRRGELALDECAAEVGEVLERCEVLRGETNGFFDARYKDAGVDPTGLVKGWAVDFAGELLRRSGVESFCVNAGGDVLVGGGQEPWRVGIQHPFLRDRLAAVVEGHDLAVATSGTYERGDHILDPHTHAAASGPLVALTVVGPDLATTDAYATAAIAMGAGDGIEWLAAQPGYCGFAIGADLTTTRTPGMQPFLATPLAAPSRSAS